MSHKSIYESGYTDGYTAAIGHTCLLLATVIGAALLVGHFTNWGW